MCTIPSTAIQTNTLPVAIYQIQTAAEPRTTPNYHTRASVARALIRGLPPLVSASSPETPCAELPRDAPALEGPWTPATFLSLFVHRRESQRKKIGVSALVPRGRGITSDRRKMQDGKQV